MNEIALIGKKIGMTREFYKTGQLVPVTVVKMEKARVINVIDLETSYDDRHRSGADHNTIVQWLSERGFELKEMSDSYQSQNWGDSVFARVNRELPPFVDENVGTKIFGENYLG